MTAPAAPRWAAWRPGPRRFLAVVCGLLFVGAAAAVVAESTRRRAIAEGAGKSMSALPPAVLATAVILEDSDGAALIVAEGLLDARAAAGSMDAARELVLATVGRRPASAHARLLLGRSAADAPVKLWKKPLALASTAAPGIDRPSVALAQRYLDRWAGLADEDRSDAEAAVGRAFFDPDFLRTSFSRVLRQLGPERTARLVPSDPGVLETAMRLAADSGEPEVAELLKERRGRLGFPAASRPGP